MQKINKEKDYYKLNISSSICSLCVVVLIIIAKIYAWFSTNSMAIFSSLLDSMLDFSASLVNLIAVRYSSTPPDDNHRFGHNKIEDIAVFAQAIFFISSGGFMLFECIKRFINPEIVNDVGLGIHIMIFSTLITIGLVVFQSFVIRRTNSNIIKADKLHFITDILTNIVTLISLYLITNFPSVDLICGSFVGVFMLRSSYLLLQKALSNLLDEEFSKEEKNKIIHIINEFPEILGIHDLKTRTAGSKKFIQFHIEINGTTTLLKAHDVSEAIIDKICQAFPESEVIIHQDPAGIEENVQYRDV